MIVWVISSLLCITSIVSFSQDDSLARGKEHMMSTGLRVLALGDSYTIGESVSATDRWPEQVVRLLRKRGLMVEEPVIIAKTGWTTDELMTGIEETNPRGPFDLVSLLIGVNNQYREKDIREYRKEFKVLLDKAIWFASGDSSHVVVLSIPDWGVTPFADGRDRVKIAGEIDRFNAVNREESDRARVHYLDITRISRNAATDPTLVANDGLHPSGRMYSEWAMMVVAEMFPE